MSTPSIVRPRLRADVPLIWRSDGRLQVGIGARSRTLSGADVTEPLIRWLRRIDGTREWVQLRRDADDLGVDGEAAERVLRTLHGAGAIDDAAVMPDGLRWASRAERDAAFPDLAAAAFAYGSCETASVVIDRRMARSIGVTGDGVLADTIRRLLQDSGMRSDGTDLVVLADSPHPWVVEESAHWVAPHLHVAAYGDAGQVGPLVVPGRTSCLRCAHLHRRDRDPDWPLIALQLAEALRRSPVLPIDRLLAHAIAARAVLLVRRWADDPLAVAAWGNRVVEVHLPDGDHVHRPAPAHPLCGCRWTG